MTRFASAALRVLHAEAGHVRAPHTAMAYDLLVEAQLLTSHRSLDVIALECLFVSRLDGTKTSDEAYIQAHDEMLVPVRTAVIRSDDPSAELENKIALLKRALQYNFRTDAEPMIRSIVNQTRKAFPGLGIKVEIVDGRFTITSDLVMRNCGLRVTFGSASLGEFGDLLVKVEEGLADWAWLQADRLRNLGVVIVRRGDTFVPVKRRIKSARHANQARYEQMSRHEMQQAA